MKMKRVVLLSMVFICLIVFSGWFRPGGTITIRDEEIDKLESGDLFEVSISDLAIADAATISAYISVSNNMVIYADISAETSGSGVFQILEAPTVTSGSGTDGVAVIQRNRSSARTSGVADEAGTTNKVTTGATVEVNGTLLRNLYITENTPLIDKGRFAFNESTAYVVLFSSREGQAGASLLINWYEDDN